MHELGVVFHIADSVTKIAKENGVEHLFAVTVELGEVSGVLNEYLVDCWNWNAKRTSMLNGCELRIEIIPAVTYCEDCGARYETTKYAKICPECGSEHTYLVQGNEINIKELLAEDPPTENLEVAEDP